MSNVVADSDEVSVAALQATHSTAGGTGVLGISPANGVVGRCTGEGFSGVFGESSSGPGVSGSSKTSVGVDAKTEKGPAALRAVHAGDGPGIIGASKGSGFAGVVGDSVSGPGVSGTSGSSVGVDAKTLTGPAALRAIHAGDGPGVLGASKGSGHAGVVGDSVSGPGVSGTSGSSVGVDAKTLTGPAALRAIHAGDGPGVIGASKGSGHAGVLGESSGGPGVSGKGATGGIFEGTQAGITATGGGDERDLAGFFRGNVEVTKTVKAFDVFILGSDCAEEFDVASSALVEPGTVMVIGDDARLVESQRAYDRRVAGIVSGAGDFKPGIVLGKVASLRERAPLALVGKVFCKADASYAAIEVGDLLTTSDTDGHAMKVQDPSRAFGAVIGKALAALNEGRGLLPVLVALQ
jgi:hypothetical protein